MGDPPNETGRYDGGDQHNVKLTQGFWLGETEVTQIQWFRMMGHNPSRSGNCDECPVENVSWLDAVEFAQRFSKWAGLEVCYEIRGEEVVWDRFCQGYRLPTEAEWEYAARADTVTAYWTGPSLSPEQANFGRSVGKTVEVGSYAENPWGLYDVHGNVWEWLWDWYGDYPADKLTIDTEGPTEGSGRVLRGGSWSNFARYERSAFRYAHGPGNRDSYLGFRLARVQGAPGAEPR